MPAMRFFRCCLRRLSRYQPGVAERHRRAWVTKEFKGVWAKKGEAARCEVLRIGPPLPFSPRIRGCFFWGLLSQRRVVGAGGTSAAQGAAGGGNFAAVENFFTA